MHNIYLEKIAKSDDSLWGKYKKSVDKNRKTPDHEKIHPKTSAALGAAVGVSHGVAGYSDNLLKNSDRVVGKLNAGKRVTKGGINMPEQVANRASRLVRQKGYSDKKAFNVATGTHNKRKAKAATNMLHKPALKSGLKSGAKVSVPAAAGLYLLARHNQSTAKAKYDKRKAGDAARKERLEKKAGIFASSTVSKAVQKARAGIKKRVPDAAAEKAKEGSKKLEHAQIWAAGKKKADKIRSSGTQAKWIKSDSKTQTLLPKGS